jgi:hypothetical protein
MDEWVNTVKGTPKTMNSRRVVYYFFAQGFI